MMTFQSTVNMYPSFGIPGEFYDDSPRRVEPFLLKSITSPNIFGYAFTIVEEGIAMVGGGGIFAGYLVNPKNSALYGVSGNPLAPTLIVPDNNVGQIANMGEIIVSLAIPVLPAKVSIGDVVIFNNLTGALSTIAPGALIPGGFSDGHAVVRRFSPNTTDAANSFSLAVIRVTAAP